MIRKSGYRFSEKIMRQQLRMIRKKPALGLDQARPEGGYRFSEKIMRQQ